MKVLGVDLGTSLSSAAVIEDGKPVPLRIGTAASLLIGDSFCLPSSVYIDENGEILLGQAADNSRMKNPARYRKEFKRDLGSSRPYKIGDVELLPEDLYKEFFKYFKTEAEERLGGAVERIVVTHPANFAGFKKELIKKAAQMSGFGEVELIDEPTAAAVFYSSKEKIELGEKILVYDLGGGTFDVSLIEKEAGGFRALTPPLGIERCGGVDFQRKIYEDIYSTLKEELQPVLMAKNTIGRQFSFMLETESIKIKHLLSTTQKAETMINLPGSFEFKQYEISRSRFQDLIKEDIEATGKLTEEIVENAGLKMSDIDKVLLVGGSSRIPYVEEVLRSITGKNLCKDADTELVVALGAAIYAASELEQELSKESSTKKDIETETREEDTLKLENEVNQKTNGPETYKAVIPERYRSFFNQSNFSESEIVAMEIGSSLCRVSCIKNNQPMVIPHGDGVSELPTFICFHQGRCFIGNAAKQMLYQPKIQMFTDVNNLIRLDRKIIIDEVQYDPEILYVFIIQRLKEISEGYLRKKVSQVVLIIPQYFSNSAKETLETFAKSIGIEIIKFIDSCCANASSFFLRNGDRKGKYLLCNIGKYHTEVAAFKNEKGIGEIIEKLGFILNGESDFTMAIINHVINWYRQTSGFDLSLNRTAWERIADAAQRSKEELSYSFVSKINIPNIISVGIMPRHLYLELRKSDYAVITSFANNRIAQFCNTSALQVEDLSYIILTGEGAEIPLLKERIMAVTGKVVLVADSNRYDAVLGGALEIGK